MLKIKNGITNNIEELKPIKANKISMYVCGPTVYGDIHLGNARSVLTFDIIYRYLIEMGFDVFYLHNITDIDDKIINKAIEQKIPELQLSNHYYEQYLQMLKLLNIKPPTKIVKVSDNMDCIIDFIKKLLNKQYAYQTEDGIYFDVSKIENYGNILASQKLEELVQSEKNHSQNKKNILDFALWKFTKIGITWNFPEGFKGRPGWHTECVALINKYADSLIDIHGGGIDLMFPHHENEIAQQLAYSKNQLANYWIHNGHLKINDIKMSKSLNNTILTKDFLNNYHPNILRYIFCSSNYRNSMNINDATINQSQTELNKIHQSLILFHSKINSKNLNPNHIFIQEFNKQMQNNFNFANCLTICQKIIKEINIKIRNDVDSKNAIEHINVLNYILTVMGFKFDFSKINTLTTKSCQNFLLAWNKNDTKLKLTEYKNAINLVINEINSKHI